MARARWRTFDAWTILAGVFNGSPTSGLSVCGPSGRGILNPLGAPGTMVKDEAVFGVRTNILL
ncbi:MAG TPA: hypothetical protein VHY79_13360 [Rhizomicrobium sp.]|nr:hypothetical protein [Rhizomicrobium sp.]